MAWLDDRSWCHPKIAQASDAGFRVWIASICYSTGFGLRGRLEPHHQRVIKATPRIRSELIRIGLWDESGEGAVVIHDWDDHNEKRDARRAAARDRKRKQRDRERDIGVTSARDIGRDTPRDTPRDRNAVKEVKEVKEVTTTSEPNGSEVAANSHAGHVLATVVDVFNAKGIPIATRHRGMLGKQARELLESGFAYEAVVLACVIALKRGEPQNAHFIAADLVTARAGERLTRREYEKALQDEMEVGRGGA